MSRSKPSTQVSLLASLPLFWQLQLAGWGTFAVLSLPLKLLALGSFRAAVLASACQLPLSIALTAALRRFYQWVQPSRQTFFRAALIVWVASATVCAIDACASIPLARLLDSPAHSDLIESAFYFFRFAVYLGWSLTYFLIKAQQQTREQAFQAAVADERHRFELLRYQLNPGFLANSLTAIAREMTQNVTAAHAMTLRLADFYQSTLRQATQGKPTTIGDEVNLLRTYLELERLRQPDVIRARFEIDDALLDLPLPPVLLLPLVEKAVKSGRGSADEPLEITVTIQRNPDGLILFEIAHTHRPHGTRPPFAEAIPDAADVRANLERYYPGRHQFSLSRDSLKERATLCLPLGARD